jgi:S1-C subfamily serine protease
MNRREQKTFHQDTLRKFCQVYQYQAKVLPRSEWMAGVSTAIPFHSVVRGSMNCVVTILDENGQPTGRGTIVDSEGWIVTAGNALPTVPSCRLSDGRTFTAMVIETNKKENLAFLKVSESGLRPVEFVKEPISAAGTFVAGVGSDDRPWAIGIVSVPPSRTNELPQSNEKPAIDRSTFFEMDIPIDIRPFERQFGVPVVNLQGEALGIINRRTQYGCAAATAQHVKETLVRLKSAIETQPSAP